MQLSISYGSDGAYRVIPCRSFLLYVARGTSQWSVRNLTAYIPSISIHHTGDKQKDRERGHFIIRSAIRWAISLDRQYDIKRWYAIAATPEGEKLVKHLGFEKIEGKRDAYLLTDIKKAARPIRSFIDMLEQEESPLVPPPRNNQ